MAAHDITRRGLLCGASVLATTLIKPTTAAASPRSVGGPRLLLLGGSQMGGAFGIYLRKALKKSGYVVKREFKSASGLARPDFFNWPKLTATLLEEFQPDGVAVMFGANDAQGLRMPRGSESRWIRWQEDGWRDEYRERVRAFADLVAPDNSRQLYWLGMPAMGERRLDSRVQIINDIYRSEIETRESGFYIETRPILADQDGHFVDHMKIGRAMVRVRAHDGIHIRGPGATRLVAFVQPLIEAHLRIVGPARDQARATE